MRDSSTACPGASRKDKCAGHYARNDGVNGEAISSRWRMATSKRGPSTASRAAHQPRGGEKARDFAQDDGNFNGVACLFGRVGGSRQVCLPGMACHAPTNAKAKQPIGRLAFPRRTAKSARLRSEAAATKARKNAGRMPALQERRGAW